ncbi:MAG TPA: VOC family protein [Candidatus Dormibacteraeota bacterium]
MTTEPLDGLGAVFDHAAVAAPRMRDLLAVYHDLLGGRLLEGGDNPRVGFRAAQLGFPDGTKIELMEPLAGSTFFDSFFRRGGGLHHITFKVPDMELAVEELRRRGYRLTGLYLDDPEWQEVFLHPREAHGVLVQLAHEGEHPPAPSMTLEDVLAGRGHGGTGVPSP